MNAFCGCFLLQEKQPSLLIQYLLIIQLESAPAGASGISTGQSGKLNEDTWGGHNETRLVSLWLNFHIHLLPYWCCWVKYQPLCDVRLERSQQSHWVYQLQPWKWDLHCRWWCVCVCVCDKNPKFICLYCEGLLWRNGWFTTSLKATPPSVSVGLVQSAVIFYFIHWF